MYQKINLIMSSPIYSTLTHVGRHMRGSATNLVARLLLYFPAPSQNFDEKVKVTKQPHKKAQV